MQTVVDYIPFEGFELIEDQGKITESFKDEVDKSRGAILAIVKGKHFCPDGVSRNRRFYPAQLWLDVQKDENFMGRLKRNNVIGRVGHDPEITDEDIGEGKFSHFTRNIDFKTGIAESVIVDTWMGRNLLTALRAGITMYVSSRATSDYDGKDEDGNDIMDTKTFNLERFDFVQDPGFLEAHPTLVSESLKQGGEKAAVVESLLRVASGMDAKLHLDGRDYVVESIDKTGVRLATADTRVCESYSYADFEDVIPALEKSIINTNANEAIQRELKIARFANEQGFDEAYVCEKLNEGMTFDAIARTHAASHKPFALASNHTRITERRESVLDRIFR